MSHDLFNLPVTYSVSYHKCTLELPANSDAAKLSMVLSGLAGGFSFTLLNLNRAIEVFGVIHQKTGISPPYDAQYLYAKNHGEKPVVVGLFGVGLMNSNREKRTEKKKF